jgi:hypothetical protein
MDSQTRCPCSSHSRYILGVGWGGVGERFPGSGSSMSCVRGGGGGCVAFASRWYMSG